MAWTIRPPGLRSFWASFFLDCGCGSHSRAYSGSHLFRMGAHLGMDFSGCYFRWWCARFRECIYVSSPEWAIDCRCDDFFGRRACGEAFPDLCSACFGLCDHCFFRSYCNDLHQTTIQAALNARGGNQPEEKAPDFVL